MTNNEIRDMLGRQMERLEAASKRHEHPRVISGLSREMSDTARLLIQLNNWEEDLYARERKTRLRTARGMAWDLLLQFNKVFPEPDEKQTELYVQLSDLHYLLGCGQQEGDGDDDRLERQGCLSICAVTASSRRGRATRPRCGRRNRTPAKWRSA